MGIKLDLHVHSESRGKIFITAEQLRKSLKKSNLDGVAITNFFGIAHALRLKEELKEYIVIVGQEVWTKDGHIVGLGLKKRIADCQSTRETIDQIHQQNGIAVAVHPFLNSLVMDKKLMLLPIDAVEGYNAAIGFFIIQNYLAKRMAEKKNIPQLASTDTTEPRFIGRSFTEVLTKDNGSILENIRSGNVRLFKRPLPIPFAFIFKSILKFRNLEPCSIHAVPCFICGNSMTVRLFKERFKCIDCAGIALSRIACCNGHYLCIHCMLKRGIAIYEPQN